MYLSRLILNPRARRAQSEIAHPYELHRSLSRAFADGLTAGSERFLYRLEADRHGLPVVLVQSQTEPDWSWLADPGARGYLLEAADNPASKSFDPAFATGQTLTFRLRANPTRKLSGGRDSNGKRVGLIHEEDQLDWLRRKAETGGFQLLSVRARQDGLLPVVALDREEGRRNMSFLAVTFDGILRVLEPDPFRQTLEQGIGSGKAMGFGLLSLARATGPAP
ncbi:MAG: type I-E CRISPR-associated protein Cas6/Cse3/CasE [Anaerolineae bacterium]